MKTFRPPNLARALDLLAGSPREAPLVPLAGGTDLLVHWPMRSEARDRNYLDLQRLGELRGVRWSEEALELGALASYWDVIVDPRARAEFPLLVDAARQVGAIQI
ncbi:MAG: FAD binding domain-containing protein, partial [Gemmatimonadota bacterium]